MVAIVSIALRRPYTFIVLAVLILIFGALSALRTPTDIFPNIGIPVVSVVWTYNGLPPDDMSGRVVYYFERSVTTQVNDIAHMESQSLAGYGIVNIFFQKTVNVSAALAQVTAASQTVLKLLPAGITPPYVLSFNASSVPILQLAISSTTLPEQTLFDYAQNFIRPQLASVAGAAIPSPYGGKVRQIQIDINPQALQAYGLSAQDVAIALARQNQVTPVGTEKVGKFEYTVQLNNSPNLINDLNLLPVRAVNGTVVYMRDVAFVHDGYPPQINVVRVNGSRAVLMTIQKVGAASTLDVINGIKRLLPRVRESLPPGMELRAVGDQSVFVTDAVEGVMREGAIAAALTGLMILIFLGSWRSTLIITISIPLAVLASITMLSILGETINVMTLGGLALAVGILVDDATVTIENINYHLEHGKGIESAIMDGARQIVVPAFVSLLCICIVFVPMFGLGGVAGYLFLPMAEAVVFALLGSFILSRTLVPTLANYLLRAQVQHHQAHGEPGAAAPPSRNPLITFQRGFEHRFEQVRARYRELLGGALRRPWRFVGLFLLVVIVSFGLVPWLGQNFFPTTDSGQIKLHVRAQIGTRIEETARLCDNVEAVVRRVIPPRELTSIVDNIGLPISGINMAYNNSGTIGVEDADILITLAPEHGPTASYVQTLRERLPRLFPGSTFSFLPADITTQILNFGLPAPIDVRIVGHAAEANREYTNKLFARIRRIPGVADARIQQASNEPTLYVDADRSFAALTGLNEREVTESVQNALAGSIQTAPTFWLDRKTGVSYPIVVQMPQYDVDSISELTNLPISARGNTQLLGALASVRIGASSAVVTHYNVQPTLDIYAAVHGRDLGSVAADIQSVIDQSAQEVPRGTRVRLGGQVTTMTEAYSQLLFGLAFAVLLIYLVIVVNFQSWLDPFVIITALPAAIAGIIWMLFTSHTTLSVPALTGAIMCMGVATANSILIVSFAREQLAHGLDATGAALEAGFTRFRPVLMTALAMVIGMAPMALGADQNAPLGRAVIGGLICATISTLFFVPTVFSLVHGHDRARSDPGTPAASEPTANEPDTTVSSH
ncbi:MAG: efflux RND transporter permease subunit [Alphaproteobacteria bacterium]|nr:efflux RND transporter permease subunit [Alphaproteobacteria bacterium]